MDTLIPAVEAAEQAHASGVTFNGALDAMKAAASQGRDSTKDLVAKIGRASRLGERSLGVLDAGAVSMCPDPYAVGGLYPAPLDLTGPQARSHGGLPGFQFWVTRSAAGSSGSTRSAARGPPNRWPPVPRAPAGFYARHRCRWNTSAVLALVARYSSLVCSSSTSCLSSAATPSALPRSRPHQSPIGGDSATRSS